MATSELRSVARGLIALQLREVDELNKVHQNERQALDHKFMTYTEEASLTFSRRVTKGGYEIIDLLSDDDEDTKIANHAWNMQHTQDSKDLKEKHTNEVNALLYKHQRDKRKFRDDQRDASIKKNILAMQNGAKVLSLLSDDDGDSPNPVLALHHHTKPSEQQAKPTLPTLSSFPSYNENETNDDANNGEGVVQRRPPGRPKVVKPIFQLDKPTQIPNGEFWGLLYDHSNITKTPRKIPRNALQRHDSTQSFIDTILRLVPQRAPDSKPSLAVGSSENFKCTVCSRHFHRQEHLKRHYQTIHTDERPFQCSDCGKGFSRNDKLSQHQRSCKAAVVTRTEVTSGKQNVPDPRDSSHGASVAKKDVQIEQDKQLKASPSKRKATVVDLSDEDDSCGPATPKQNCTRSLLDMFPKRIKPTRYAATKTLSSSPRALLVLDGDNNKSNIPQHISGQDARVQVENAHATGSLDGRLRQVKVTSSPLTPVRSSPRLLRSHNLKSGSNGQGQMGERISDERPLGRCLRPKPRYNSDGDDDLDISRFQKVGGIIVDMNHSPIGSFVSKKSHLA